MICRSYRRPWPVGRTRPVRVIRYIYFKVALLQETHLAEIDADRIKKMWVGVEYHSSLNPESGGTSVLIHKSLTFQCVNSKKLTLGRIYNPNGGNSEFFKDIADILSNTTDIPVILGGDWNTVLDRHLDKSNYMRPSSQSTIGQPSLLMNELDLKDIWRQTCPKERDYTYFSRVYSFYSKLTFFLSSELIPAYLEAVIDNILISDHAPVILTMDAGYTSLKSYR
uniref:Endonuclease/exonuclease/phosphatase domain-containing protein n=1 Tax=Chrysemys picta bellii TaxID=8478 RepID=A0A8C3IJT6_CHRPI